MSEIGYFQQFAGDLPSWEIIVSRSPHITEYGVMFIRPDGSIIYDHQHSFVITDDASYQAFSKHVEAKWFADHGWELAADDH